MPDAEPWLIVIDPQQVFAAAASPWGSPMFPAVVEPIQRLAARFGERTIVTRWVAPARPRGSWLPYLRAWPFARVAGNDPLYSVVPELADLPGSRATATTFGKWPVIRPLTGPTPHLVLTGVATDCCVISTALAAADAGATVRVVTDGCAGSSLQNQQAALQVLSLYPPQITLTSTDEVLGDWR